jgi:hypothetical protein
MLEHLANIADIVSAFILAGGGIFLYNKTVRKSQGVDIAGDDNEVNLYMDPETFNAKVSAKESEKEEIREKYNEER